MNTTFTEIIKYLNLFKNLSNKEIAHSYTSELSFVLKNINVLHDHLNIKQNKSGKLHNGTVVMQLCIDGNNELVEYLINNSYYMVNIHKENNVGNTAFIYACKYGHLSIIELFNNYQNFSEDLVYYPNNKNNTGFMYACKHGHLDIVKYIMRIFPFLQAHTNAVNNNKHNCIIIAADNGHKEIVEILLEKWKFRFNN